ncbi:SCO family protein [Bradyrhizobium sp. CSA112]|uniref:SCO family protein n=1 Tax=Bradyrhizobium sp. CSA112 TaxID=2699170 RepID=UPI0023B08BF5|nr:SCO family protein [Bradyrhizobium sp. CSA112]MDE5454021.1 SCO family protein [Bradyrhizobium sp. CSA112]
MTNSRVLVGLVVAAGLLGAVPVVHAQSERSAGELMDAVMWGKEPIGGPFTLIDHTGKPRTDADFLGKLMLVYFGFSFCPDVCPTDLMAIGQAVDKLGPGGDAVQPLFVTVDPDRDTPAHLADYVPSFHPRLLGLTGDAAQIRDAARLYRVFYAKVPVEGAAEYTIDHSGFIYLMDRDGKYLGFFPPGTPSDRMVAVIKAHLSAKR